MLPSYKNQSINLLSKSVDWILYDGNFGIVNKELLWKIF